MLVRFRYYYLYKKYTNLVEKKIPKSDLVSNIHSIIPTKKKEQFYLPDK